MVELRPITALLASIILNSINLIVADLNLTILHTNDVHCRFLSFNSQTRNCEANDIKENHCWGGAARRMTLVERFRRQFKNTLFLDAGDQYQASCVSYVSCVKAGFKAHRTIWFTMLDWEPIAKYMNLIKYDAMCLGNHDFDHGIFGLVPFLANITCKIVDSNIYSTDPNHPSPLEKYFQNYLLYTFVDSQGQNQTVAVVGYTISTTPEISSPGPDVGFSVKNARLSIEVLFSQRMALDEIPALQRVVDQLKAKGVKRIIALGHSGINMDRKVCRSVKGLDLVIGGHTNTFLYTGQPPIDQTPEGPYPEVYRDTGENCLVVQAYAYGQYLGFLQVNFDENGQIDRWNGNPILIDAKVPENPEMVQLLEPYSKRLVDLERQVVGMTEITINTIGETCKRHECPTANGVADAFVEYYRNSVLNESNSPNASDYAADELCNALDLV
uniref:5'-nucleotidase n=1 Tax=Romanomermis culicivorax TaxID=13658 RepID=A0A915K679_ROMCU